MAYGTVKVDNITFDNGGSDQNVTVSGLYNSLTSGITVTGTISGAVVIGSTSVSGTTVAGVTVTGTTVQGASGTFTSLTGTTIQGTTATFTSGIIASGTAAAPSLAILGDPDTGVFSPGADQLAVATNGAGRLYIASDGKVGIGDSAPSTNLVIRGSGASIANVNTHFLVSDSTTATAGVGGSISFEGNYTSGGARAAWAAIAGTKENATDGNYAGSLKFYTRPNGNSSQLAMTIDSSQRVGIGTTSPGSALEINAAAATSPFIAKINTSEAARIDPSGRLLVGTSSAFATRLGASAITPGFQVKEGGAGSVLLFNGVNGASPATIYTVKSRGATYGTIVQNNDNLFRISAAGDDGVQATEAARIDIAVDGTPGANDMPGRLVFSTTADGASSPAERMRITSAGLVGIGTSAPGKLLEVSSSTDATIRINDPATIGAVDRYIGGVEYYTNDSSGGAKVACSIKGYHVDLSGKGRLQFATGNETTAMTINGSQQVGIGTASPVATLHIENTAGGDLFYALGSNSDVFKISSDSSTINLDTRNTTGGLAFQIQGTEKARIDSSGRLLVGTSSARETSSGNDPFVQFERSSGSALVLSATKNGADAFGPYFALIKSRGTSAGANNLVSSGDEIGSIFFYGTDGTNPETGAAIQAYVDGTPGANDMPGRLVFSTTADGASSPTERMRIGQSGYMKLSNNGSYLGTAATYHEIIGNAGSGSLALSVANTSATGNGVQINSNSDGTSYVYLIGYSTSAAANRIIIWSNGNVVNTNNSYGAISDIKLKENIVDANSQWDDLKALQVRNYNFKEGQTHTQIGLVAQEVELVSPGLVTESPDRDEDGNDLGTVTKSVNYSVLYMKAVKALQEAMERIESLEQRLNDAGIN
jgi:hypothetical protein